jgi:hypothetical protein
MKWLGVAAFASLALNDVALARDFTWITSPAQMSALSSLAAGYAGGLRCDRIIDATVAGAFLTKTFGGRPFSAQEVAEVGKMIAGVIAMQTVVVRRADPRSCATVRKYFGPGGSTIPGLLD